MRDRFRRFILWMAVVIVVGAAGIGVTLNTAMAGEEPQVPVVKEKAEAGASNDVYIAMAVAAVTIGASWSAAYAVAKIGSAAMGAVSENPDLMARSLIFVGLAEGIAIYGLIIAIMLLGKMG